jgi:hypothetical protein
MITAIAALVIIVANVPPAQSANGVGAPYAYVREGQLVMVRNNGEHVPVTNPPASGFDALTWHAGKTLAYVQIDRGFTASVRAANLATGESVATRMTNLAPGYPLLFTPDGRLLAVLNGDPRPNADGRMQMYVVWFAPDASDPGEVFANFAALTGCGGGSPFPTDRVYAGEAGFGGRPQFLALSGNRLLYTPACGGSGLEMLDLDTGERTVLADPLDTDALITNPALSPDGHLVAAVRNRVDGSTLKRTLVLIDVETGSITDLSAGEHVELVAWSAAGDALYYSTRQVTGTLPNTTPHIDMDIPQYEVAVRRVTLATGKTTELYRNADAWAIGRLAELPDGSLAFSVIGGLQAWLAAIFEGRLDITKEDEHAQMRWVSVNVYRTHNRESKLICEGCTQFTVAK